MADVSTPPRPAAMRWMLRTVRGSDAMRAARSETADGASGSGTATALGAADRLCLAAAPTFAIMALLAGIPGGGPPDTLCSAAPEASALSGMVTMYLLMSAFHSAPWLKLISSRRGGTRRP